MAHECQMQFVESVKQKFPDFFTNKRVLEVGSYNVNGTVRVFFKECDYTGIDVTPGDCVDVVCAGQDFKDDKGFDTIITCEMMEHNPFWAETFHNLMSILVPGGLLVLTCATTGRGEHGTRRTAPSQSLSSELYGDYYHNLTEQDFRDISNMDSIFSEYGFSTMNTDLYLYGIKRC